MTGRTPPGATARLLDEAGGARAMTAVMAIMVFLTVLAAALGLATGTARAQLDRRLAGRMTVQVVDGDVRVRDATAARVVARLRAAPGVAQVSPVDPAALRRLLAPWLGEALDDPALPVPALIDVDLTDAGAAPRVAALAAGAGPGVRVERQAAWMSPVASFMRSLVLLAALLVLLMAAATAAVVVLAARAGLAVHRATIEVMHMLGATDRQVARLFQRRLALDAAIGGGGGAAAALAVVALVGGQVRGLGSELVGAATLAPLDWLLLVAVPLGFVALAVAAARIAITRALERQL